MQINVDGDKETGWIVSIHNGDVLKTYSPEGCDTVKDAATAALEEFEKEHGETKTEITVTDHRAVLAAAAEPAQEEAEESVQQETKPSEPGPETA